jgi:hypothetical protein
VEGNGIGKQEGGKREGRGREEAGGWRRYHLEGGKRNKLLIIPVLNFLVLAVLGVGPSMEISTQLGE